MRKFRLSDLLSDTQGGVSFTSTGTEVELVFCVELVSPMHRSIGNLLENSQS